MLEDERASVNGRPFVRSHGLESQLNWQHMVFTCLEGLMLCCLAGAVSTATLQNSVLYTRQGLSKLMIRSDRGHCL